MSFQPLPRDPNGFPAESGYAPGVGVLPIELDATRVNTDATNSNEQSAPLLVTVTNPSAGGGGSADVQYVDGTTTPTHPTGNAIAFDNGGTLKTVSNANPLPISGSISATNPSVGTDGSAIPTSSTLLGGSDGTNLQPLQVDGSKYLKVNVAAGSLSANNASVGTTNATAPTSNTLIGASDGTNMQALQVESSSSKNLRVGIYQGVNEATITQFHSSDNQSLGTGNGLLTGGVAQIVNPGGLLDRQRGTGADGVPAVGIATGAQQLAGPPLTTTFTGSAVTGNALAQSVQVASSANLKVGDMVVTQDNVEYAEITVVTDATHVTGIFKNNHAIGQTLTWYHYNQARDASVGDAVVATGMGASATYLYNNVTTLLELDRSANGEKDGATGQGTAVAAEYEYNAGGPLLNTGLASGLSFDRARNLQGKGVGSATQNAGGAAGATSITVSSASATNTLQAGQQIRIDRNTGTEESAYVSNSYTPGTAAIALQSALQYTHTASTVEWDIFASNGPGLNGFTPAGIGIEEEALYNPVDGKYYIERSATQDAAPGANIVAEAGMVWNGSTFDRMREASADALAVTGIAGESELLWNGSTFDRARSIAIGDGVAATGIGADGIMLYNGSTYDRLKDTLVAGSANVAISNTPTVTANIGTTNGLALEAGGHLASLDTHIPAQGQTTMSASMPVTIASNQSAIPITGSITATNPSVGTDGSAIPTSSTLIGASDGTNLQQLLVESSTNRNLRTGIYSGANEATVTGSNALKVDGSAVTQPVSNASLPLPAGASTSAKQPALGTAGTASTDVLSVQGIASMTALKVDGSAVTQPVSAASLPLPTGAAVESGGHLASIDTHIPAQGAAVTSASLPVNIASDQTVAMNVKQVAGATLSGSNAVIVEEAIRNLVRNGQAYSASTGYLTGPATTNNRMPFSFFVPNTASKNILLLSLRITSSASATSNNLLNSFTTDPAFGTNPTIVNLKVGGAASVLSTSISYSNATQTATGTAFDILGTAQNATTEAINPLFPLLIPTGNAFGLTVYVFLSGASANWGVTARWLEY